MHIQSNFARQKPAVVRTTDRQIALGRFAALLKKNIVL